MDSERTRFLSGDRALIAKVESAIRAVARRSSGEQRAFDEELIQEALVRVFLAVVTGKYRGEASIATFAGKVAKFTYLEAVRRRRRQRALATPMEVLHATASNAEEDLIQEEERQTALRAAAALPQESLELIRLIFVERIPYSDVATRLGISEGALRVRIHRCRERLTKAFDRSSRAPRDSRVKAAPWRIRVQRAE